MAGAATADTPEEELHVLLKDRLALNTTIIEITDFLVSEVRARVELLCQYGEEAIARFTDAYVEAHRAVAGPLALDALAVWEVYVSAGALNSMGNWGLDPTDEAHRRRPPTRFFEEAARRLD